MQGAGPAKAQQYNQPIHNFGMNVTRHSLIIEQCHELVIPIVFLRAENTYETFNIKKLCCNR
jgi:hypothetical protein